MAAFGTSGASWQSSVSECGCRAALCRRVLVGLPSSGAPRAELVHLVAANKQVEPGLAEILGQSGFDVNCYSGFGDLERKLAQLNLGCIVLDLGPSAETGLACLRSIRISGCTLPVIFIADGYDVENVVALMRAGASDCILKPVVQDRLIGPVAAAISQSRIELCRKEVRDFARTKLSRLTPTEFEVARLLAEGHLLKKIASQLGRSENTVKIHRSRIMSKLELGSPAAIAHLFNMSENS